MSGRRIPLSSNQNVANSPLRASVGPLKQKRPFASLQREEPYGHPPPLKRIALEGTSAAQRSLKSPSQQQQYRVSKSQVPVPQRRNASSYEAKMTRERTAQAHQTQPTESLEQSYTEKDIEQITSWQVQYRERFPKMVFYFEKVPNDVHHSLSKQLTMLGARQERFFSIDITHVVTTRSIPPEKVTARRNEPEGTVEKQDVHDQELELGQQQEQAETINPSVLTRYSGADVKKFLHHDSRVRKLPLPPSQVVKQPQRSTDILLRAKEMGKKVWTLEKLQRIVKLLLENDPYVSLEIAYGQRGRSTRPVQVESRGTEDRNLFRLLHNERINGPSDRDSTVLTREMHYFKGPYIYVYDIEEKQKPIMVREYSKVKDKADGKWPQFQTASLGRCPFIEDSERREAREARNKAAPKVQVTRAAVKATPVLQPPQMAPPKPIINKQPVGSTEASHNRGSSVTSVDVSMPPRPLVRTNLDGRPNMFTSHAAPSRSLGGEPVASGVQPSGVTSAIRSQMISSTSAIPGIVTGLSKEVHGLQRQVLKRNTSATSHDLSSRRTLETSFGQDASNKRPLNIERTASRKVELIEETRTEKGGNEENQGPRSKETRGAGKKEKADDKTGWCENCCDKYNDFNEHIESSKHRKFAKNDENWAELDELLAQLERIPKRKTYSSWQPSRVRYDEDY